MNIGKEDEVVAVIATLIEFLRNGEEPSLDRIVTRYRHHLNKARQFLFQSETHSEDDQSPVSPPISEGQLGAVRATPEHPAPFSAPARVPAYIEHRIRARPPAEVVPGSTPVVSFGDARLAWVATLGINPSSSEFLAENGRLIRGQMRRLETCESLDEDDLSAASPAVIERVFQRCNEYFNHNPYTRWFGTLEKVLTHLNASYYDGSACHLDLVQWATARKWGKLTLSEQYNLLEGGRAFLEQQLLQEHLKLLLLNGKLVLEEYRKHFHKGLVEVTVPNRMQRGLELTKGRGNIRLYSGRATNGIVVIGWDKALKDSYGVSNVNIATVGEVVAMVYHNSK